MMTDLAPALALGLYWTGLVAAFGVRSWIHRARTGSTGFRGISGAPGTAACPRSSRGPVWSSPS